jgi:hypothetical protein
MVMVRVLHQVSGRVSQWYGGRRRIVDGMMTTYLDEFLNGEHSTVAVLYKDVDVVMLNELSNFFRRDGASALPYSGWVFSPYADNNLSVLRRHRSKRSACWQRTSALAK